MTLLTGCLDAELNDVPLSDCPENFGQTQKALVSHLYDSSGNQNKFEPNLAMSPTDPSVLATWTTILGATDETKPVPTPFLSEPVSEPGAERTYGGGNATPNGVLLNIGREPQLFEAKMLSQKLNYNLNPITALKTFQKGGGTGRTALGIYLVNEAGQIMMDSNGLAVDAVGLELYPIPIHKFFISDRGLGGLENVDNNMISWQFAPNWSDKCVIITPSDFNGLDLANS